jgi:hypothetical protein
MDRLGLQETNTEVWNQPGDIGSGTADELLEGYRAELAREVPQGLGDRGERQSS